MEVFRITSCKNCNIELDDTNTYQTGSNKYRKLCKKCHKESIQQHQICKKFYTIDLRRGNQAIKVHFPTYQSRHDFLKGREIQSRFGRSRISPSSRLHQSVWTTTKVLNENNQEVPIVVQKLCRCTGIVRYSTNNYQVCDNCGMVFNYERNFINYEQFQQANKMTRSQRYKYIPIKEESEYDQNKMCYDVYYQRAYSKKLRT